MPNTLPRHHEQTSPRRPSQRGLTAVELMVTLSILAVLTGLAGPSLTVLLESWRVRNTQEALHSTLLLARSEAIKRGGHVTVQKTPNNTNGCTTARSHRDWDCGWVVCEDMDNNGTCGPADPVLQRITIPQKVQITRTGGGASIKFDRWGLVDGAWLGFSFVPLDKSTNHPGARGLCMSSGGRIHIILPEAIPCTG